MFKRNLISGLALVAMLLGSIAAVPLAEAKDRFKWWESPEVQKDLNLSAEELKSLDQLNLELRREMLRHRTAIRENRLLMNSLLEQEPLDEAELNRLDQIQGQAQAEISRTWFNFIVKVRKLLGAERYKELREVFEEFRSKRKKEID